MKRKWNMAAVLLTVIVLFGGCAMRTVDRMYAVPKRSAEYQDLQRAIDAVMVGLEYCAPLSGENQQTVQMADLDGDGVDEYLLFAKGNSGDPLKIFIFSHRNEEFTLSQTLECRGSRFETVEYVELDDSSGKELVIGLQVSDQVPRYMSVYSFSSGLARQLMGANYTKFVVADLDHNEQSDLMVIAPGSDAEENAVVTLFQWQEGAMSRSREVSLSGPGENIKRIMVSRLYGGRNAVYVASSVEESAIITDVFAIKDGHFTNVSLSNESGTSIQTLRNHYVYADDIDEDGTLELPCMINMLPVQNRAASATHHLIRWYAMTLDGEEVDKMHTFHDFDGGWYMTLDADWASRVSVVPESGVHTFYVWNETLEKAEKLLSVYSLAGADREMEASRDDRFELYKTDGVTYAAKLEVAALSYGLTEESLLGSFHLIHVDWKTGET